MIAEKARIEAWGKRVLSDLAGCENDIKKEQENIKHLSIAKPSWGKYLWSKKTSIDRSDLFWEEDLMNELQKDVPNNYHNMENCKQRIQSKEERKKALLKELDEANKAMNIIMNRFKITPRYAAKQKPHSPLTGLLKAIEAKKLKEQHDISSPETLGNNMQESEGNGEVDKNPRDTNDRIISSNELLKINSVLNDKKREREVF